MKTYLYRFCAYIFLSMFLALAFGPFGGNPFDEPYQEHVSYGSHFGKEEIARKSLIEQAMSLDIGGRIDIKDILQKPQIKFSRYILAVVFFLSGLVLLKKAYKTRPGIAINPRWAAVTGDMIFILFLGFAAYCVIAYGLEKFTGASPYLYDPTAMWMTALAYVPVVVFVSFFASNFSGQSIEIGDDGITTHYPEAVQFVPWGDIHGFELKETCTVVGGSELLAPRKMQTKLVLHTRNGDLELFEPGLKKTKSLLISGLRKYAPERLQEGISQLIKW